MKKIEIAIAVIICAATFAIAITFGWFTNAAAIEPDVEGYSVSAYFGGGDGSEDNPYIIKSPRHLYNLAWLQYLGTFNKPGVNNIPDNSKSTMTQYTFSIEADLDMNTNNGIYKYLPPIGTNDYPFVGKLLGNGHSISNLVSTNDYSTFLRHPSRVVAPGEVATGKTSFQSNIVGFVGAIGSISGMINSNLTINSTKNSVSRIGLDTTKVDTISSTTLVGVVAGYVNGTISDIGVVNGKLNIANTCNIITKYKNLSGYSVVGYAEDDYKTKAYKDDTVVYNPTSTKNQFTSSGLGFDVGWGGSIDMYTMYTDVLRPKWDKNKTSDEYTHTYYTTETITKNKDGVSSSVLGDSSYEVINTNLGNHRLTEDYSYVNNDENNKKIASYSFLYRENSDSFMYLAGNQNRTVSNAITVTTKYPDAFVITNGSNYLSYNTTTSVKNVKATSENTYWYKDDNNHIYNLQGTTKYYLNENNDNLALSTVAITSWTINGEEEFIVSNSGKYLYCDIKNDSWKLLYSYSFDGTIISYNGYYLNYSSSNIPTAGTNKNSSTLWYEDNNGYLYTVVDGINYYLCYTDDNSVYLSTNIDEGINYIIYNSRVILNGYTNYSVYYNGSWRLYNGTRTLNIESYSNTITEEAPDIVSSTKKTVNYTTEACYYPLRFGTDINNDQGVAKNNTGYLVGGANRGGTQPSDIRVSEYSISNIKTSYSGGSFKNLYTFNDSSNSPVAITNNVIKNMGWTKYNDSLNDFKNNALSKSSSYVYGLHFMESTINKNNTIRADWVSINGSDYISDYELPEDCIDFNLVEKGKVNFFAGDYFSKNDSFFSYHEIQRSGNDILAIREIVEVLSDGDESHSYVYKYSDGKYSVPYIIEYANGTKTKKTLDGKTYEEYSTQTIKPSNYNTIFKMSWIGKRNSSFQSTRIFYFEVPTNDGEYALGSVSGGAGAYLLYLDIGANAQKYNRTTITQNSVITTNTLEYINGIQILSALPQNGIVAGSISAQTSAVAMIVDGNEGEYTLSKLDKNILIVGGKSMVQSTYICPNLELRYGANSSSSLINVGLTSISSQISRRVNQSLYVDKNTVTKDVYYTLITDTIDSNNSLTRTKAITGMYANGEAMNSSDIKWNQFTKDGDSNIYMYNENGDLVVDTSVTIDVSGSTSSICEYNYQYENNITPSFEIAIVAKESNTTDYYEFDYDDINVGFVGGTNIITINVTSKSGSYIIKINGSARNANSNFTVIATE